MFREKSELIDKYNYKETEYLYKTLNDEKLSEIFDTKTNNDVVYYRFNESKFLAYLTNKYNTILEKEKSSFSIIYFFSQYLTPKYLKLLTDELK